VLLLKDGKKPPVDFGLLLLSSASVDVSWSDAGGLFSSDGGDATEDECPSEGEDSSAGGGVSEAGGTSEDENVSEGEDSSEEEYSSGDECSSGAEYSSDELSPKPLLLLGLSSS
jgi:hypothetical protein